MNRTKEARRARTCVLISIGLFLCAVASALIPKFGDYLALAFAVFGGFLMLLSTMMRDRSRVVKTDKPEPQTIEEQL